MATGELMPMRDETDSITGYLKILRDRTEQYEVGRRLQESEAHWRAPLD